MPETKKYSVIYADPPWRYDMKRGNGVAENHYPTMSMEDICALPVAELAAKDSALFLWATFPQLNEAFRVMEAWGFRYKTLAFLWLKQNRKADSWFYGMGFWTRGLPAGDQRPPETPVRGDPPVCDLPYRAAQQKAGRGAGKNRKAHGRPAQAGAVRKAADAGLGCVGK